MFSHYCLLFLICECLNIILGIFINTVKTKCKYFQPKKNYHLHLWGKTIKNKNKIIQYSQKN